MSAKIIPKNIMVNAPSWNLFDILLLREVKYFIYYYYYVPNIWLYIWLLLFLISMMSNFLDIDFVIKLNAKRSRRFDLSEVIFKGK